MVATARLDLAGKRVVGEINAACRECEWCARGLGLSLPAAYRAWDSRCDGVFFAEYLCLPDENLFEVPASVPDEAAVFTEPLTRNLRPGNRCAAISDILWRWGDGRLRNSSDDRGGRGLETGGSGPSTSLFSSRIP